MTTNKQDIQTFVVTADIISDLLMKYDEDYYCDTLFRALEAVDGPDPDEIYLTPDIVDMIIDACHEILGNAKALNLPRAICVLCKDELAQSTYFIR